MSSTVLNVAREHDYLVARFKRRAGSEFGVKVTPFEAKAMTLCLLWSSLRRSAPYTRFVFPAYVLVKNYEFVDASGRNRYRSYLLRDAIKAVLPKP
jgi:hypothetical protein